MTKKVFLPLTQKFADSLAKPTVTAMRERLGGRLDPSAGASFPLGSLVEMNAASGNDASSRVAVVLSSDQDFVYVYVDQGLARRTSAKDVTRFSGATPAKLVPITDHLRVFASLIEGSTVWVEKPGRSVSGVLREKCRYGGIVELPDGTILAAGFSRLWPDTHASS